MRRLSFAAGVVLAIVFVPSMLRAQGGTPPPRLGANVMGINTEYAGMFGGDDLLPYTDDDLELEEGGNPGGNWGFGHFDNNSDGVVDEGEPIFVVQEGNDNDDDDTLYTPHSRPEYGVLHESEDWMEFHEANQAGPTGPLVDPAGQADFEINDWNGWCDEANAYLYNNLGNNQRGLGLPKYRVDYRTEPAEGQSWVLDEVEGFSKTFGFRNRADDPDTPFNERGSCNRWFRAREEIDMRGYLIPVEDFEDLGSGSLPSLFGWEADGFDLATYLKEEIVPRLDDEDLSVSVPNIEPNATLPPTHVYLLQMSVPMSMDNGDGECGGSDDPICAEAEDPALCQVQEHGKYWGIPTDGSGTYRSSHLMAMSMALSNTLFEGIVHPFVNEPDDGAELNLWVQDHFWRAEDFIGKYTFQPESITGTVSAEPLFVRFDDVDDSIITLSGAGAITAPISRPISAGELPMIAVVDLAENVDEDGGGAGDTVAQIILRNGEDVVAYASLSAAEAVVSLGGSYDMATGTASGGTAGDPSAFGAVIGIVDTVNVFADYTRFVLIVDRGGASLRQIESGDYEFNDFTNLDSIGEELASVSGAAPVGDGVAQISVGSSGKTVLTTLLLFASPGTGPFIRGDCNQDGGVDLSDGLALLNFLFLEGFDEPGCMAACAANGGSPDLSAAIYIFNFLFLGGPDIPAPTQVPAYSQSPSDAAAGCESYDV